MPQDFSPSDQELPLSLTRRKLFMAGGAAVLAVAGLSGALLSYSGAFAPHLVSPAKADDPPSPDLLAELAKPAPDGDMALGSDKAPVTIIEYASMTCPHCAHFSETTFPELKKRYIDTGKVRYIFREFPFDKLAAAGFMLARCASKDGGSARYMAVVETLFAKQNEWVVPDNPVTPLQNIAKQLGFTDDSFKACLTNQKILDGIESVRNQAVEKLRVTSTPTFFINGKRVAGDVPIETLAKEIDPLLKTG
jgi:protein-disulfide isomerase